MFYSQPRVYFRQPQTMTLVSRHDGHYSGVVKSLPQELGSGSGFKTPKMLGHTYTMIRSWHRPKSASNCGV